MPVGIADATGGEAVPLPRDDVLAGVLDQEAGAFTSQRPRDAFGDLERAVLIVRLDVAVNAVDQIHLVLDPAAAEQRIIGRRRRSRRRRGGRGWGRRWAGRLAVERFAS